MLASITSVSCFVSIVWDMARELFDQEPHLGVGIPKTRIIPQGAMGNIAGSIGCVLRAIRWSR